MSYYKITVSIVTYKTDEDVLRKCIESVLEANLNSKLYVIDNSPTDKLKKLCKNYKTDYTFNSNNIGYGAGHNIGIKYTIQQNIKYHLVLNADIFFKGNALNKIYDYMDSNDAVGLLMPKILYPNNSMQHLCKLLPTPFDLIRRRFLSFFSYLNKQDDLYELKFADYNRIMDVPNLSGCFMFLRTEALKNVGLFDDRFFMYFEDVDLVRRIHKFYKTIYYPYVSVHHNYEKGSYKNWKLLKYHICSAIKYFNKWGYWGDKERQTMNKKSLLKLNSQLCSA